MSIHSISIVPTITEYPNRLKKANEILDWLVQTDIIKNELSDCILKDSGGYRMSAGATFVVRRAEDFSFDQTINGLEVITEKKVFDTGEHGLVHCLCPNCQYNTNNEDFYVMIENWYTHNISTSLCPQCQKLINIQSWQTNPVWGFSDLGFTFWNWPIFTIDFLNEFSRRLDSGIKVVHQHV